jgi:hypothetical protein
MLCQAAEEAEAITRHRLVMNEAVNKQLNEVGAWPSAASSSSLGLPPPPLCCAPRPTHPLRAPWAAFPHLLRAQEAESLRWIQEHWHEVDPTLKGTAARRNSAASMTRPPTLEEVRNPVQGVFRGARRAGCP